jgi:hypothetical protein
MIIVSFPDIPIDAMARSYQKNDSRILTFIFYGVAERFLKKIETLPHRTNLTINDYRDVKVFRERLWAIKVLDKKIDYRTKQAAFKVEVKL